MHVSTKPCIHSIQHMGFRFCVCCVARIGSEVSVSSIRHARFCCCVRISSLSVFIFLTLSFAFIYFFILCVCFCSGVRCSKKSRIKIQSNDGVHECRITHRGCTGLYVGAGGFRVHNKFEKFDITSLHRSRSGHKAHGSARRSTDEILRGHAGAKLDTHGHVFFVCCTFLTLAPSRMTYPRDITHTHARAEPCR